MKNSNNHPRSVSRFVSSENSNYFSFDTTDKDINTREKKSDRVWYTIPKCRGLGTTILSDYYGIKNIHEAHTYLRNRFLRDHLRIIIKALLKHSGIPIVQILGHVDSQKLWACATLFYRAARTKIDSELFKKVLDTFFDGKEDKNTIKSLGITKSTDKGKRKNKR